VTRHYRGPRILSALGILLAIGAADAAEETVTFRFAPGDGETWTTTTATEARLELGEDGALGTQAQSLTGTARATARRREGGWTIEQTIVSMAATRNGEAVPDPVMRLMEGLTVTLALDPAGHLEGIRGFGALAERARAAFPPEVVEAMGPVLAEDALVRRETSEWAGRIGDFAGKTVRIGDAWKSKAEFPLPDGRAIAYEVRTTFAGLVPCEGRTCVRIVFAYGGDTPKGGLGVVGEGERLVEPDTMRVHSETVGRTILTDVEAPGSGRVHATRTERRTSTFTYGVNPAGS